MPTRTAWIRDIWRKRTLPSANIVFMMPTSPPSPYHSVRRVFPQYGWKMCISDRTCLAATCLSLLPAYAHDRPVCHRPSCRRDRPFVPALSLGKSANTDTAKSGRGQPAPQGSSLRSGLFCPSPSSLNRPIRPTRRHVRISPQCDLYRTPSLCGSA